MLLTLRFSPPPPSNLTFSFTLFFFFPTNSSGQWYYECELRSQGVMQVGWADGLFAAAEAGDGVGDDAHSWAYDGCRQQAWTQGSGADYGLAWSAGDTVRTRKLFMEICSSSYLS